MLEKIANVLTVAWVALYFGIAQQLQAKVFYRVDDEAAPEPDKAIKLDLFVFLYVFCRQYRDRFPRELAIASDVALGLFVTTLGVLAYLVVGPVTL